MQFRNGTPIDFLGNQSISQSTSHQSKHTLAISTLAVSLDWYFCHSKFPTSFQGYSKTCPLWGKQRCCQQNGMLAAAESRRNGAQQKRACHSSISFGRVSSRPCRTEFLLLHCLPGVLGSLPHSQYLGGIKGRVNKNGSLLITPGR